MTDRLKGVTVVFEPDLREDDAQPIIDAIKLLRGVIAVTPQVEVAEDHFARTQALHELRSKLWEVIK